VALTTYATLQTAVASWLHRSDLTSVLPDFVTLAEADLGRELRLRLQETTANLTTVVSQSTAALPTDFREPLECFITWTGCGKRPLYQVLPEKLPYSAAASPPDYWAIDGANVLFADPIDSITDYTISLRYLMGFDLSANSGAGNTAAAYLLAKYPDAYLFGTLLQAGEYIGANEQRMARWEVRYRRALHAIQSKEDACQDPPVMVDAALQLSNNPYRERIVG
jgi:hypothetical protein